MPPRASAMRRRAIRSTRGSSASSSAARRYSAANSGLLRSSRIVASASSCDVLALRFMVDERQLRVLYAFDPRRTAILLIGGDKSGDPKWYERFVPIADDLFDRHLKDIGKRR